VHRGKPHHEPDEMAAKLHHLAQEGQVDGAVFKRNERVKQLDAAHELEVLHVHA